MKSTCQLCAPVITFLSPSSASASLAVEQLLRVTASQTTKFHSPFYSLPTDQFKLFRLEWNVFALQCRETGTVLQWIASTQSRKSTTAQQIPHALLAVQDTTDNTNLVHSRRAFIDELSKTASSSSWRSTISFLNPLLLHLSIWMGREVLPYFIGRERLPFLALDHSTTGFSATRTFSIQSTGCLKELTIPIYEDAVYADGSSFLDKLSNSSLSRPVPGVYCFGNNVALRPLPAAKHDRVLSSPTLVFHTTEQEMENMLQKSSNEDNNDTGDNNSSDGTFVKIGFTGHDKHVQLSSPTRGLATGNGQVMLRHNNLMGIDVRFSAQTKHRSMFAEAQHSMLAGSLPHLQSMFVLQDGFPRNNQERIDPKTNQADCWMEFRATLARPAGYFDAWRRRTATNRRGVKVAKVPELPYE